MARPLRIQYPDGIYHVTARGNDRRPIFEDDDDCACFLVALAEVVARYRVRCHAYCLMGNHYHLLLQTPEANLSAAMRQLNGVYTQRFNRRHERCGHLLQGRFGAQLIDAEAYLREVCRYVVLNPVRAGLCAHPREWKWSSFQATALETIAPGFLSVEWVRTLGGARDQAEATRRYVSFVEEGIREPETSLAQFVSRSMPDNRASATVGDQLREAARCAEFPRAQRFALRPTLPQLFADVTSRADRDARAIVAILEHGYTMREVAEAIGRHYITVSRALARASAQHDAAGNVGM